MIPVLLAAVADAASNVDVVMGTVTQAAPLLVRADNATTAMACKQLATYTIPTVGHRVLIVVVQGVDRFVLDRVV